jgi:hypothetical protein
LKQDQYSQARGLSSIARRHVHLFAVSMVVLYLPGMLNFTGALPARGGCLKCLETNRERRYGSAEALADDLQDWVDDKPTRALPLSKMGRYRLW